MTETRDKTDHELKAAIDDELEWTPTVKADQIGVAVHNGAVTLSGQVETYPQKAAAVRAALRVRGVTALADEIIVETQWENDDADIARAAGKALQRSVVVPPEVKATVHNHVVTLTGTVPWHYQREASRRIVTELPGVREVVNSVDLRSDGSVSATEATAKITSALIRNAQLDAGHIKIGVHGGVVTLSGTVSSWAERRQAEHTAYALRGVTDVDNRITIVP